MSSSFTSTKEQREKLGLTLEIPLDLEIHIIVDPVSFQPILIDKSYNKLNELFPFQYDYGIFYDDDWYLALPNIPESYEFILRWL